MSLDPIRTEPLSEDHRIEELYCGRDSVDTWIREKARAAESSGNMRTHVCLDGRDDIVGFVALRTMVVDMSGASNSLLKNAGAVDGYATGVLLAQMGVNENRQKQGLGTIIVHEAMRLTCEAHDRSVFPYMIVDAADEELTSFYGRFGFRQLSSDLRMIMRMSAVRKVTDRIFASRQ